MLYQRARFQRPPKLRWETPPQDRRRITGKQAIPSSITEDLPMTDAPPSRRQVLPNIPDNVGKTREERSSLAKYYGKALKRERRRLALNRTAIELQRHFVLPVPQHYDPQQAVLKCRDCAVGHMPTNVTKCAPQEEADPMPGLSSSADKPRNGARSRTPRLRPRVSIW